MHARRFLFLLVVGALLVAGATPVWAQDRPEPPADRKDVDRQLYRSLRAIIDQGADLYNEGNHQGAYYLFHGALVTAGGLVSHHPKVQTYIQTSLANAARLPRYGQRALSLRAVLDQVRTNINPDRKPAAATLWDRLGGDDKVRKLVDEFVTAAAADPKVDFTRGGKVKDLNLDRLKKLLVEQISDVSGGPYRYTGRSMREVHRDMGITDAQFDALVGHLKQTLEKNGAKPDDAAAVLKVLAGTRPDIIEKKSEPGKGNEKKPAAAVPVEGHLTLDGKPLPGARVELILEGAKEPTATALTGEDGTFALERPIKPGTYQVRISKTVKNKELVPARYNRESALRIMVAEGRGPYTFDLATK